MIKMSQINSLLEAVKNLRFVRYVDDPKKSICPYLRLTNLYDNPDFSPRKRQLFIENRNALKTLTDFLTHKDCPVKSLMLQHFMLDDGTNSTIENYTSKNDFKILMNAIKKNKTSIRGLTFIGKLSNGQVDDVCNTLPRVGDGRPLVYLKLTKECVNNEQFRKVLESLESSSLKYLHVTENKFSEKIGKTFKEVLPKLLHLRDVMFEKNYTLRENQNYIDNFLFLRSQQFREDLRIAINNNISISYFRTDFMDKELFESFMDSSKFSKEIKQRAQETQTNINGMVNMNFDIQRFYGIYKKNRGIRQMGLSDKQAHQSIRNPKKERLPLDIRRYIHEFIPSGLMGKGGISSFIKYVENFRDAMAKIVKEVSDKKEQEHEKRKYIQQNFQHLDKDEIKFLLSLDRIYQPPCIWTYLDLMLDKIYCYARANNIYLKTKDGKPPKLKNLKLLGVDEPTRNVGASRKRKLQKKEQVVKRKKG